MTARSTDVKHAIGSLTEISASVMATGDLPDALMLMQWGRVFTGKLVEWGVVSKEELAEVMETLCAEAREQTEQTERPLTGDDIAVMVRNGEVTV